MSPQRFIVFGVALVAVVGVLTTALRKPDRKVAGPVTVVVPRRELRDSGPANQGSAARRAERKAKRRAATNLPPADRLAAQRHHGPRQPAQSPTTGVQNRPLPSRRRRKPKAPRKHRPSPQRPVYMLPAGNPAPPPCQSPPVTVTAPVPLTVTTPLVGVNPCP